MKIAVFSSKPYDRRFLQAADSAGEFQWHFFEERLNANTARLIEGAPVACLFVNDDASGEVLEALHAQGCRLIALRCAGFNNIIRRAEQLGIKVAHVPAYSPHAVAEHTLALMLALNRKTHRAYNRVREGNFSLDGLMGFDMHGKTLGIVGTGRIGLVLARIAAAIGCRLLAFDVQREAELTALGGQYVELDELFAAADIVSLHCPLVPATHRMIDRRAIERMKPGVMLINTSRGGLVDTLAVIAGLKQGKIGYLGLDVYEQEADLFFEDLSETIIQDDLFQRLLSFPNVLVTGHQAFFTDTALASIAGTTIANIRAFAAGHPLVHEVASDRLKVRGKH